MNKVYHCVKNPDKICISATYGSPASDCENCSDGADTSGQVRTKLTVQEFNLVSRWTSETKIDSVLDIQSVDDNTDIFYDFDNDIELTLEEGFEEMADAIAYPFSHEGFTEEESEILLNLLLEFGVDESEVEGIRNMKDN